MNDGDVDIQRQYYARTAGQYDQMHLDVDMEHFFALSVMSGIIDYLEIESVLDVGAGTGRGIRYLSAHRPHVNVLGIEPVAELRAEGHKKGVNVNNLVHGDATQLEFEDESFDLVCEFAVLHHIRNPELAVAEMLRVAKKAIFISDANRFGQGRWRSRKTKQWLASMGLWTVANWIKTKGKGYTISEGDGLAYSYSVFDNFNQIKRACHSVHIVNTIDANTNIYDSAASVALLGIKKPLNTTGTAAASS